MVNKDTSKNNKEEDIIEIKDNNSNSNQSSSSDSEPIIEATIEDANSEVKGDNSQEEPRDYNTNLKNLFSNKKNHFLSKISSFLKQQRTKVQEKIASHKSTQESKVKPNKDNEEDNDDNLNNKNKKRSLEDKLNDVFIRTLSAIVILPPVILFLYKGDLLTFILISAVVLISSYEWTRACGGLKFDIDDMAFMSFAMLCLTAFFMQSPFLGFIIYIIGIFVVYRVAKIRIKGYENKIIPKDIPRNKIYIVGYIYIVPAISCFAYIRGGENGLLFALWIISTVIASDVAAYFAGSIFGGKKIMPRVSPNKSYNGLYGGMIASSFMTYIFGGFVGNSSLSLLFLGAFISIVAHAGDFLESGFKRYIGVKDMSNLIPGHGGLLDRIDALLMVSLFTGIFTLLFGKNPLMF